MIEEEIANLVLRIHIQLHTCLVTGFLPWVQDLQNAHQHMY